MASFRALVVILPLFAAASCGEGSGPARTPLVVYSAHAADILAEFEQAFEAANPTIDVRTHYAAAHSLLERIRAERSAPQADVWWGGDATSLATGAAEGLLAPYRPTYADEGAFPHDAEWRWSSCFYLPMVLAYHPSRIQAAELPKRFAELADPRFKGRLVLREPSVSGTMRTFLGTLIAREMAAGRDEAQAFALLKGIDANVRAYEGSAEIFFEALEKGPGDVSVWNLTDLCFQRAVNGYGFLPAPLDEPVPTTIDGIALTTRGGPKPEARAFYEFVNGHEALAILAERHRRIPVRPTFDPAKLRPELRDFPWRPAEVDPKILVERSSAWMRKFEEEVRGARGR